MKKPDRYSLEDFEIEWAVSVGKGDADVTGVVSFHGLRLGAVKITVSKFRVDHLNYDRKAIIRAAERAFINGLNRGQYREIANGVKA